MRNLCWGLVLLLVPSVARATDEPLQAPPLVNIDDQTDMPFLSFGWRAMSQPELLHVHLKITDLTTGLVALTSGPYTAKGPLEVYPAHHVVDPADTVFETRTVPITAYWFPQFPAQGGRPWAGPGLPDGQYAITFLWQYEYIGGGGGNITAGTVLYNIVGGVWTLGDVPEPPPVPPTAGSGALVVTAKHLGIVQSNYTVVVSNAGPNGTDLSGVTDATGKVRFEVPAGGWQVHCAGQAAGVLTMDSGVRTAVVARGSTVNVVFGFDSSGKDTAGSGGTSGSPNSEEGTGGWLVEALKAVFIPKGESVDLLKAQVGEFFDWGPFSLIQEFVGLATEEPTGKMGLAVPLFNWSTGVKTGEQAIDTTPFTNTAVWGTIRFMLGMGVWLGFAMYVKSRLMPQAEV